MLFLMLDYCWGSPLLIFHSDFQIAASTSTDIVVRYKAGHNFWDVYEMEHKNFAPWISVTLVYLDWISLDFLHAVCMSNIYTHFCSELWNILVLYKYVILIIMSGKLST
ncbi:hypothetical protein XELAEV_18039601mg [Xenopus laevis]|uniref:Uncharacterized protein n=1 Tax=Xenopus laevis TaxID=8355 RepID=A0A974C818_XENLA|nr:hypothetical protein XELAEV_18039601mg [Xenopus laevis]